MKKGTRRPINEEETLVLDRITRSPGITAKQLAAAFREEFTENDLGSYIPVSRVVMRLRGLGLIDDVESRCAHCGRASRSQRNVPLRAKEKS